MKKVLSIYKHLGKTPLDTIEEFRRTHPEYADVKMGYAGRLDPMAEGLLLVLVGDENKNRKKYLSLDKTYEIEILFGIATDTYDVLGCITDHCRYWDEVENKDDILQEAFTGTISQQYPPYSSMTVNGKPLYWWAREGRLEDIHIPVAQRHIHDIRRTGRRLIDRIDVVGEVWEKLATLQKEGFRKDEVVKSWKEYYKASQQNPLWALSYTVTCSSGTYMRALAHDFGQKIGVPALAFSIKRTRVGSFMLP